MSRIEKMVLDNKNQIMKNMQTIQNKMDMFTDKSPYLSDGRLENITTSQQDSDIKQHLVQKFLSWSAWNK